MQPGFLEAAGKLSGRPGNPGFRDSNLPSEKRVRKVWSQLTSSCIKRRTGEEGHATVTSLGSARTVKLNKSYKEAKSVRDFENGERASSASANAARSGNVLHQLEAVQEG